VNNHNQDTQSFIVRVWQETRSEPREEAVWRGVVTHVGSQQQLYFQDLSRLMDFIKEKAGIDQPRATWWRMLLERIRNGIKAITGHATG
jgi:hypothetical protein